MVYQRCLNHVLLFEVGKQGQMVATHDLQSTVL